MKPKGIESQKGRKSVSNVNVTTIRCTVCMQNFALRKLVKYQGAFYHEECMAELRKNRHKNYKGIPQDKKRPPMRGV